MVRLSDRCGFCDGSCREMKSEDEFRYNNRNLTKKEFEKMILRVTKKYLKEQRKNKIS
jgi:hypothetical protein